MTKRKKFKRNAIASSENYNLRRKIHREFLRENHESNSEYFDYINDTIVVSVKTQITVTKVTTKCFGKTIVLDAKEVAARHLDSTIIIKQ